MVYTDVGTSSPKIDLHNKKVRKFIIMSLKNYEFSSSMVTIITCDDIQIEQEVLYYRIVDVRIKKGVKV